MLVPAMIETTSVFGPTNDFSAGPASRNICGFTATTSVSAVPASFGLRRTPLAVSALISSDGEGSTTITRFASRPPASHPVSIAPPILPAPARAMVPGRWVRELAAVTDDDIGNSLSSSLRTQGPITTGGFSKARVRPQAVCLNAEVTAYGSRVVWDDERIWTERREEENYASPSVSNIAALMASAALFPAQTTNWNAG